EEETCRFPIRQAASHRRNRTQDSAIGSEIRLDSLRRTPSGRRRDTQHRFQTFFAMRRKVSGRTGKRSAFPDYQERLPQTQNKKRKSHEKSKHTVQTSSKSSDPASPRLPWSSVYLGTHSGSSPRDRAVQRHSLGVCCNFGVSASVYYPRTRDRFRKRDSIGSLHRD